MWADGNDGSDKTGGFPRGIQPGGGSCFADTGCQCVCRAEAQSSALPRRENLADSPYPGLAWNE